MKTIFLYLLHIIANLSGSSDAHSQTGPEAANEITIGNIVKLNSQALKEEREVWVYLPRNIQNSTKKYPVVYLLDGTSHFHSFSGMVQQLSQVNGNTVCPEMIVIGIKGTNRTRDLTPSQLKSFMGDTVIFKSSGGLANFMMFLDKELIPYVEKNYPASNYRTFVGHSLGGLAVVHALLNQPDLFSNYISLDPSLWWEEGMTKAIADSVFHSKTFNNKSLFIGLAHNLPKEMTTVEAFKDTTEMTEPFRISMACVNSIEKLNAKGLNFLMKYYKDEDHGSLPYIASYDAMRFLFPWHSIDYDKIMGLMKPGTQNKVEKAVGMINDHYANVSHHFRYTVLPDETFINNMGYQFLANRESELAFTFFEMNTKNYPDSYNAFDSLGDYYLTTGDKAKATENFQRSLKIKEMPHTRKKLNELKGKE